MGDMLSNQGLQKSVELTVDQRYGRVFAAIFEMKAVLEDLRLQMIGGIKCGIDIWELAIIPSLLNNCSTWVEISSQSVEKVNKLQNIFLQTLFAVGQSCPSPALCWDTDTLQIKIRIDQAKLNLLHHIKNSDKDTLAKQVYDEQSDHGWPGLVSECRDIMKEWGIPDITRDGDNITKAQWKNIVKKEARNQNSKSLSTQIKKSSKLEKMKNEEYKEKPYLTEMSMHSARMHFKIRSRMFPCKMNFLNDPKNRADMWRCDSCRTCIDSQSHILYCPAYQELRVGKSLSSDQDIVTYFKEVMEIRTKLNLVK